MMPFRLTCVLLPAFWCYMAGTAFTQTNVPQQKAAASFPLFFEKVYLHLDRTNYAAGDDLWFKAYLVNGQNNMMVNSSHNLYVELLTPGNEIAAREVIRLDKGEGHGDFKLPDSLTAGRYRIRAYTNWMRNFGNLFVFEKEISIAGEKAKEKPLKIRDTAMIRFFPEGGSLVMGVTSQVAFKAENRSGKGLDCKGVVMSSRGEELARFQTVHAGMGSFVLKPEPGISYTVKGQWNNGTAFTAVLPEALPEGLAMHITPADTCFTAHIETNAATLIALAGQVITVAARYGGKLLFKDTFTLKDTRSEVQVPRRLLPEGVAAITLYDAALRPHAERLVYVSRSAGSVLQLHTDQAAYQPGGQVQLSVQVQDAEKQAVPAHLSVAVVDAGLLPVPEDNIRSYLLLQSELRGTIEQAAAYFDEKNSNSAQQLDLLLCTQGWRDFVWRRVKDTSITIRYLPEPGVTLSGKVTQVYGKRPAPGVHITLTAPGARGDKLYFTKTDTAGAYYLDDLPLYGQQRVRLTARTVKGTGGGRLSLDPVLAAQMEVSPLLTKVLPDTTARGQQLADLLKQRKRLTDVQRTSEGRELEEVKVSNKDRSRAVALNDGVYSSFGGPDSTFNITPADIRDYERLNNFLLHRMPGASLSADNDGISIAAGSRMIKPRLIVNRREDANEWAGYYLLPMDEIETVRVRHMLSVAGGADMYLIYLTLKPEATEGKAPDLLNTTVSGYYEARTFYSPPYDPGSFNKDARTTLYWNPDVITGNSPATVSFGNTGNKGQIRIVAEGVTTKGEPVSGILTYPVR